MGYDINTVIFVSFLLITLVLGLSSSFGIKNIKEYAIGDRNFSTATIVATIVATWICGEFFYTTVSETYTNGLYSMWVFVADPLYLLIVGTFFAPRMKEFLGKLSIAEAMGSLFGQKVRIITAMAGFIGAAGLIGLQLKLAGLIFEYALGISNILGIFLAAIIITLYSSLGGIKSVTFTDVIQFFTFGVVVPLIAYVLLISLDDINIVVKTLSNDSLFDYKQVFDFSNDLSIDKLFLFLLFIIPEFSPVIFQRVAMASSTKQVRKSFIIASMVCFTLSVILQWIGILILSIRPNLEADEVIKQIIFDSSFVGLKGAALAGIMAMIMSTVDSYINSTSVLIVHDFCKPLNLKFVKGELLFVRVVSLCVGAFALLISLRKESLLELLVVTYSFYLPIVTAPFIMAVLGFRSTGKSVLIGMGAGIVTVLIWNYVLEIEVANPAPLGMLMNLIFMVGSHYLLNQKGGWVGIEDNSELVNIRSERKRKLRKFISDLGEFNLFTFCRNNCPKGEGLISILGFFVMISVFISVHTLPQWYQIQYTQVISVFYPIVLCSSAILISYPLWLQNWKNSGLIGIFWNIIMFFVLVGFSFLVVLISKFSEIQLMVFMTNIIVISALSKWKWALINILVGVGLTTIFYDYYYYLETEGNFTVSQFKISYLLLLISSSLVLFLKPKQEYQAIIEEKNKDLKKRINAQEKEVSGALALREKFIRNISHEYHAPITGIPGIADVLKRDYHSIDDNQRLEAIDAILKSSMSLELFDSNIASLSKLNKMGYSVKLEPIYFTELVLSRFEICCMYGKNLDNIDFCFDIEGNVTINGDQYYLTQVLDNLIINSMNYGSKGKVTIELKQSKGYMEFNIVDEGSSVSEEEQRSIFQEFSISSKKRNFASNRGVSLSLIKKIIDLHMGSFKIESDGKKGTKYSFYLPKRLKF